MRISDPGHRFFGQMDTVDTVFFPEGEKIGALARRRKKIDSDSRVVGALAFFSRAAITSGEFRGHISHPFELVADLAPSQRSKDGQTGLDTDRYSVDTVPPLPKNE